MDVATRLRGCLLAGAVGDALGAPLEFLSGAEIRDRWGPLGPEGYVAGSWPPGSITDDTQMTLFTAEGVIRARTRIVLEGSVAPVGVVFHAYRRWYYTQGGMGLSEFLDGWLVEEEFLHRMRAPGNTCLSALNTGRMGTPEHPLNDSKGCGTVMRIAPAALWDHSPFGFNAFDEGVAYGAITHGHPTGYLAGGFQAQVIAELLRGASLDEGMDAAEALLRERPNHAETLAAVEKARTEAAAGHSLSGEVVERVGEGWIAEEALAIGLYCALVAPDLHTGLRLAVAHGGDSDSTGAVAGNLLGAIHGPDAIPQDLLEGLEARDVIEQVAVDLAAHFLEPREGIEETDLERYPAS